MLEAPQSGMAGVASILIKMLGKLDNIKVLLKCVHRRLAITVANYVSRAELLLSSSKVLSGSPCLFLKYGEIYGIIRCGSSSVTMLWWSII